MNRALLSAEVGASNRQFGHATTESIGSQGAHKRDLKVKMQVGRAQAEVLREFFVNPLSPFTTAFSNTKETMTKAFKNPAAVYDKAVKGAKMWLKKSEKPATTAERAKIVMNPFAAEENAMPPPIIKIQDPYESMPDGGAWARPE